MNRLDLQIKFTKIMKKEIKMLSLEDESLMKISVELVQNVSIFLN